MAWATTLTRLPTALRNRGIHVIETPGWRSRGYDTLDPVGQLNHHTAIRYPCGDRTAQAMIEGRTDLPGPLCNGHGGITADGRPVLYLIAGRRARHAGAGALEAFQRIAQGFPPLGNAASLGYEDHPDAHGNRRLFGWEWQHPGDNTPWHPDLLWLIAESNAALADLMNWSPNRSWQHKQWTRRKIDMSWPGDLIPRVRAAMEDNDVTPEQCTDIVRRELAAFGRALVEGGNTMYADTDAPTGPHAAPRRGMGRAVSILDTILDAARTDTATVTNSGGTATMDDETLRRIAVAVADEQARRQQA